MLVLIGRNKSSTLGLQVGSGKEKQERKTTREENRKERRIEYQVKALSMVNSTSRAAKTAKNLPACGVSSPHLLNLSRAFARKHAPAKCTHYSK